MMKRGVNRVALARRERLLHLLCDPEAATLGRRALAEKVGLSYYSVLGYLKQPDFREELARRQRENEEGGLAAVDRAMLKEAQKGNVAAAKLVYARLSHLEGKGADDVDGLLKELDEARAVLMKTKTPPG